MQIPGLSSNGIPYLFTKCSSGLQTVGVPRDKESQPQRDYGRGEERDREDSGADVIRRKRRSETRDQPENIRGGGGDRRGQDRRGT